MAQCFEMQPLEKRQLFAGLFPPGVNVNPTPPGVTGAGVVVPHSLLHGEYPGSYSSQSSATSLELIFNHRTHGRRAHGSAIIQTPDGLLVASFIGTVAKHRLRITLTANGLTGTLTGRVSHTGGSIRGSFQFSGLINGTGKFSVGKP